jgi:hypothetical protein
MHNNTQKQLPDRVEEILIFVATMAGLVIMVLYWR